MEENITILLPLIKWTQSKKQIFVTIMISDVEDIKYEIVSSSKELNACKINIDDYYNNNENDNIGEKNNGSKNFEITGSYFDKFNLMNQI